MPRRTKERDRESAVATIAIPSALLEVMTGLAPRVLRGLVEGNDGGLNISWDQGKSWDFVNTMSTGLAY